MILKTPSQVIRSSSKYVRRPNRRKYHFPRIRNGKWVVRNGFVQTQCNKWITLKNIETENLENIKSLCEVCQGAYQEVKEVTNG